MIRKEDILSADKAFANLMSKTERMLNDRAKADIWKYKSLSSSQLEKVSHETLKEACKDTPFRPEEIILVSGMRFPDILAERYYGVEVKSPNKDHWTSTGSSIVENTRDKYVKSIYMLFGKLGGTPAEFMCRPYQDVLSEIAVTHSPRYRIDMTLGPGETIFDKMGISYDTLRSSDQSIDLVRRYYRGKSLESGHQMPWWISSDDSDSPSFGMNIRSWKVLTPEEKSDLIARILVLFPEVIFGEYENAAMWLVSTQGIVCTNLRDPFSAGGKVRKVDGNLLDCPLPHILKTISDKFHLIVDLIENDIAFREYINTFNPDLGRFPLETWLLQVQDAFSKIGVNHSIKDLLESELE